jgi:hypothetical protein
VKVKQVALALLLLCALAAFGAAVVFAYIGCFTSSTEAWSAAFVSAVLAVVTGFATSFAWNVWA